MDYIEAMERTTDLLCTIPMSTVDLEAVKIVIAGAEKQIPEKIKVVGFGDPIWPNHCPSCHTGYMDLDHMSEKYKYCPECGQRLDWETTL